MSFYTVLGVEPTASADQIKAAYRRAAMRWHPDRNRGNQAETEARFKELAEAYTVLSDPTKRSAYDEALRERTHASAEQSQARSSQEEAAAVFFQAMVEMAMALAQKGYNRDVLLDALLSQGCPAALASAIADQVHARRQAAAPKATRPKPKPEPEPEHRPQAASRARTKPEAVPSGQARGQNPGPTPGAKKPMPLGAKVFFAALLGLTVWAILPDERRAPPTPVPAPMAEEAPYRERPVEELVPSRTLKEVLAEQIPGFNGKSGRITYASLPPGDDFNGHRSYMGTPYEIELLQSIEVQGKVVAFFASKPVAIAEDDFSCHACSPILSAMMIDEFPGTGFHAVLALQPLTAAGGWGSINLQGDSVPFALKVGPERSGFIFKGSYMGQGIVESYASIFGIEPAAFKTLGFIHLSTNSSGSGECYGKPESQCPSHEATFRFVKTAVHGGYYDLMVKERTVEVVDSVARRAENAYTMRYNGVTYAPLKAPPKAGRP